jgi:hypothetical protein
MSEDVVFQIGAVGYSDVTVGNRSPVTIARHSRGSSLESVTLANSFHLGVLIRDSASAGSG